MTELEALAMVQELDTHLDQLKHRRVHLPEHVQLGSLDQEQLAVNKVLAGISSESHELERDQKRFEDEIAVVVAKKNSDTDRMYNTGITSPKELSALEDELASLGRRQEVLEDQVLELMEQIEPLTSSIASHESRLAEVDLERGRCEAAIVVAEAEIDAEVAALTAEREDCASQMSEALSNRYDSLRSRSRDGVVVGRVGDGRCTACGLRFPSVFLDEVKHSDHSELKQCEECGVLLVT